MKLGSTRSLESLKPVLQNPQASGPDPSYYVFYELTTDSWANNTNIAPGKIGEEFNKTFGHYHSPGSPDETYHVVFGEGVFLLQQKYLENNQLVAEKVSKVCLIKAKAGDEIVIPQDYGHSWSNIGQLPLITFDDWRSGHTPADYEPIEKMQGMAYYLVEDQSNELGVKAIPNPHYQNLPEPQWLSASEFNELTKH